MSRSERHESTQIFGSIFSRSGRKSRRDTSISTSTSSLSPKEDTSARERYYGQKTRSSGSHAIGLSSKKRQPISGPYNFQHVTHTRQEHLPNLERTSPKELVSEFTAIKASQAPTNGELKGIRAEDLHFENFSSETLNIPHEDDPVANQTRQKGVLRKSLRPIRAQRPISYAKSHDNLRMAPPRPPRSPLSPTCPVDLPTRTSSRTASVLIDTFDPSTMTTSESFRKAAPYGLPMPPPFCVADEDNQSPSHAITTPGDEAWPLTAALSGTFPSELPDVEEEEEVGSRMSRTSSELRMSKSVPSFRTRVPEHMYAPFDCRMSEILGQIASRDATTRPLSPGFRFNDDSWEQDIDYCYDHEIEANCDYQWDRYSMEEETVVAENSSNSPQEDQWEMGAPSTLLQPTLELHLEDDDRSVYHGRFRPSLLIPSAFDVPELSPMSNASIVSPELRTPQTFTGFARPGLRRSPSQASSFKESHGFNLSPTLLIPSDFQSEMDAAAEYHEHFGKEDSPSATIIEQGPYNILPMDESTSSVLSYRSSNFSRGSARSSSNSRLSSRFSHDAHQSIGSSSSLPDLIPSSLRRHESVQEISDEADEATTPQADSPLEMGSQRGPKDSSSLSTTPLDLGSAEAKGCLSPVAESQEEQSSRQVHGRKVSAPVVSQTVKEFKGRPRAGTVGNILGNKKAPRGSYMLFPQT